MKAFTRAILVQFYIRENLATSERLQILFKRGLFRPTVYKIHCSNNYVEYKARV